MGELKLLQLTEDGRIALTASSSTFAALKGYVYQVRGTSVDEQLREICMVFKIDAQKRAQAGLDRRCGSCNGVLQSVPKDQVVDQIPAITASSYDEFFVCSTKACARIFWHGGTYKEGIRDLRRIVDDCCFHLA